MIDPTDRAGELPPPDILYEETRFAQDSAAEEAGKPIGRRMFTNPDIAGADREPDLSRGRHPGTRISVSSQ
jgi:hypothetical protein